MGTSSLVSTERFRRTMARAALAPLVGALILAGVFLWQIARLLDQERWVAHTSEVIALANRSEKLVLRMQSSMRGYLISRESDYLDRYRRARDEAPPAAEALVALVSDNPPQTAKAKEIASVVDKLREDCERVLQTSSSGGDVAAHLSGDDYRALLRRRDDLFAEFIDVEEGLRSQRTARAQKTTWLVVGVSLAMSATLGVLIALASRRSMRGLAAEYEQALASIERARADLERRVDERTAELRDVVSQLEAFNYTVSHDLRAPLRAMQGFSQALVEDYNAELPPKARQYTQRIAAGAARMDEMIHDLLEYSRLGRADLPLSNVDLNEVVAKAMRGVAGEIDRSGATVDLRSDLPVVRANAPAVVMIVSNLLANAVKFVEPGERPNVRVYATSPSPDRVRLWVADGGIGIDAEHQSRIFNIFERLHGVEQYSGTGIGLAIVKRAAERMGGACGVESELGKGSRFWVELPAAASAVSTLPDPAAAPLQSIPAT